MKKLSVLGIIGGAALLTAAPFSLQWSQKNVALSFEATVMGRTTAATAIRATPPHLTTRREGLADPTKFELVINLKTARTPRPRRAANSSRTRRNAAICCGCLRPVMRRFSDAGLTSLSTEP